MEETDLEKRSLAGVYEPGYWRERLQQWRDLRFFCRGIQVGLLSGAQGKCVCILAFRLGPFTFFVAMRPAQFAVLSDSIAAAAEQGLEHEDSQSGAESALAMGLGGATTAGS